MPTVDRAEIRRMAADPGVILVIEMIDCFFEGLAERMVAMSEGVGGSAEAIIEDGWKMMQRGIMRLYDPDADAEDAPFVLEAVNSGQRARARVVGDALFAVRQHLRRAALQDASESATQFAAGGAGLRDA